MLFQNEDPTWFDSSCPAYATDLGQASGVVSGLTTFRDDLKDWFTFVEVVPPAAVGTEVAVAYAGYDGLTHYQDAVPNAEKNWLEFCGIGSDVDHTIHDAVSSWFSSPSTDAPLAPAWSADMASNSFWGDTSHDNGSSWGGGGTDISHGGFTDAFSASPSTDYSSSVSSWGDHSSSGWDSTPAWGGVSHDSGSSWDTASTSWDSGSSWGDSGSHDSGSSHDHGGTHDSGTGMDSGSIF